MTTLKVLLVNRLQHSEEINWIERNAPFSRPDGTVTNILIRNFVQFGTYQIHFDGTLAMGKTHCGITNCQHRQILVK